MNVTISAAILHFLPFYRGKMLTWKIQSPEDKLKKISNKRPGNSGISSALKMGEQMLNTCYSNSKMAKHYLKFAQKLENKKLLPSLL